jgi:phosphate transport system substrate-binding protein
MNHSEQSLFMVTNVVRRVCLLGAASLSVYAATGRTAQAQSVINGGGATQDQSDWQAEQSVWNTGNPSSAQWGTYWGSGSGAGQTALLNDDLTCDINKVSGANGGNCTGGSGVGQPGNTVDYAASDIPFTTTQISTWATYQYGQAAAGDLISVPTMGLGMSIAVRNSAVTANGKLILSDDDLCGVFSGKLTDFSQLTLGKGSVKPTAGTITVPVRSDSAAGTYILTNHLSAVCTTGSGGNSNITFTATTTFANLFGGTLPGNFIGEKGDAALATEIESLPSALSYITPEYTTVDPNSGVLVNGEPSTILVTAQLNGTKGYVPTTTNIKAALSRAKEGSNLTPPASASAGLNPNNWLPIIQTVSAGYPIVGYAAIELAQCYANKTVGSAVIAFLNDHYTNSSYLSIQSNNGYVSVANSGAAKFLTAIRSHILSNKKPAWNQDIDDKTACAGLAGR